MKFAFVAAPALVAATPTFADARTTYVGTWAIDDYGSGCQAGTEHSSGAGVVLDAVDQSRVTFIFHNPSWISIESGKSYTIEVEFDGALRWPLKMTGTVFRTATTTSPGLMVTAPFTTREHRNLLREFVMSSSLRLHRNGSSFVTFNMSDNFEAFEALLACLEPYGVGDLFDNAD